MVRLEFCCKQLWCLVRKDLNFNWNCRRLLSNLFIYTQFLDLFPLGKGYYLGKIYKKLKLSSPHIRSLITAITTIQMECGFAAVHAIVATWHSVKPVVLLS